MTTVVMGDEPVTRFEGRAMASPLRLTLGPGGSGPAAEVAWQTVVASFEASEQAMSRFRETSELTAFNRVAGRGVMGRPSGRLRRALSAADRAVRVTGGRFDPRVLVDLDRLGYRGAPLPDAVDGPGGRRVVARCGRHELSLSRPVDLGGIGKGLALRWAAAELAASGWHDILLEAGGDLVARGFGPGGDPWLVGIEDPRGGEDLAVIAATDLAVATSSVRVNRWTVDGRTVHHLIDPRTHEPADGGLLAVTVASVDPAWSEIWAKVLFLDGRAVIGAEARSRGLAAWWVGDDGTLEMTAAARMMTVWTAAEDQGSMARAGGSAVRER
jgi:thiamine biosynthesis lipoprotein